MLKLGLLSLVVGVTCQGPYRAAPGAWGSQPRAAPYAAPSVAASGPYRAAPGAWQPRVAPYVVPSVPKVPTPPKAEVSEKKEEKSPLEVRRETEAKRRAHQFKLDQAWQGLEYHQDHSGGHNVLLLNELATGNPYAEAGNLLIGTSYSTMVDKLDDGIDFYLATTAPDKIDRFKLDNMRLKRDSVEHKRDAKMWSALGIDKQLSDYAEIERRNTDQERANLILRNTRKAYDAGKADDNALRASRRMVQAADLNQAGQTYRSFMGKLGGALSPAFVFSHFGQAQDIVVDLTEEKLWAAEEKFRKDPTRENRRALRLADMKAESAELKSTGITGTILSIPLITRLTFMQHTALDEEIAELEEEVLYDAWVKEYGAPRSRRFRP